MSVRLRNNYDYDSLIKSYVAAALPETRGQRADKALSRARHVVKREYDYQSRDNKTGER